MMAIRLHTTYNQIATILLLQLFVVDPSNCYNKLNNINALDYTRATKCFKVYQAAP